MKEYLEERIKYLKKVEMEYFNKQYEVARTSPLRNTYREFSNMFEARRSELEITLKFFNEGVKP